MFHLGVSRIRLAAGFAVLSGALLPLVLAGTALAQAESYPGKPVRFVISFPAGSATDQVARLIAPQFTRATGQAVVVENRGGAAGIEAE